MAAVEIRVLCKAPENRVVEDPQTLLIDVKEVMGEGPYVARYLSERDAVNGAAELGFLLKQSPDAKVVLPGGELPLSVWVKSPNIELLAAKPAPTTQPVSAIEAPVQA